MGLDEMPKFDPFTTRMNFRTGICPWCGAQFNAAEHQECDTCRGRSAAELVRMQRARFNLEKPLQLPPPPPVVMPPLADYFLSLEPYLTTLGWSLDQIANGMKYYLQVKKLW